MTPFDRESLLSYILLGMSHMALMLVTFGTAGIARQLSGGRRDPDKIRVAGVANRDLARADESAYDLDIPRVFCSHDALLADSEIETIFNPPPDTLKSIIYGKPLAMPASEAKPMFAAYKAAGVPIVECFGSPRAGLEGPLDVARTVEAIISNGRLNRSVVTMTLAAK